MLCIYKWHMRKRWGGGGGGVPPKIFKTYGHIPCPRYQNLIFGPGQNECTNSLSHSH